MSTCITPSTLPTDNYVSQLFHDAGFWGSKALDLDTGSTGWWSSQDKPGPGDITAEIPPGLSMQPYNPPTWKPTKPDLTYTEPGTPGDAPDINTITYEFFKSCG